MLDRLQTEEWLRIITESATEVATVALGFKHCGLRAHQTTLPEGLMGAYLPLGTNEQTMQVGFLSDRSGCQMLAKALLGLTPEDEDLSTEDLSDAISELANVVAGGIKRRVTGGVEIKLGLPLFVTGCVQPNAHLVILTAELELGSVTAVILFATPRENIAKRFVSSEARIARLAKSLGDNVPEPGLTVKKH